MGVFPGTLVASGGGFPPPPRGDSAGWTRGRAAVSRPMTVFKNLSSSNVPLAVRGPSVTRGAGAGGDAVAVAAAGIASDWRPSSDSCPSDGAAAGTPLGDVFTAPNSFDARAGTAPETRGAAA